MSESETKLYLALFYEGQRLTKVEMKFSTVQLVRLTGLSANSLGSARKALADRGMVKLTRSLGGYIYSLCDPSTGEVLPGRGVPVEGKTQGAPAPASFSSGTSSDSPQGGRSYRRGMSLSELRPEQYERFFRHHLADQAFTSNGDGYMTSCPFHADSTPSLSVSFKKGLWKCHGCEEKGGILEFERLVSKCDTTTAFQNIAAITGENRLLGYQNRPEAVYPYCDEDGRPLFEVLRYPGKRFTQRRPTPDGRGWIYDLEGVRRVLYRLPEVLAATTVLVVEGEKDVDRLVALELRDSEFKQVAVTTNPGGAGKWKAQYSQPLAGKRVMVIPDSDDPGLEHADNVYRSLLEYGAQARLVVVPDLAMKDVSEFLDAHSPEELVKALGEDWFYVPSPAAA